MYFMTLSFWHRALLREGYGIEAHEIEWHTTSDERDRRQKLTGEIRVIPNPGPHLGLELLLDGFADVPQADYDQVLALERRAIALGYPELA